jgi:site-specific DNA recombinase
MAGHHLPGRLRRAAGAAGRPARHFPRQRPPLLLSGILRCGRCGAGLYGQLHSGGLRYACVKGPGLPGCGEISITAGNAESEVPDQILTVLDSPEFVAALITAFAGGNGAADDVSARLRDVDARREELAAMWAAGEISRREWHTARDELSAADDALTVQLSLTPHSRILAQFAAMAGAVWDRWQIMTTGARRALTPPLP